MNLAQDPTTIRTNLRKFKQNYTLRLVKDIKKEILNEIFPKDKNIAFHPSNCLVKEYEDIREDNLFKLYSQIPLQNPSYAKEISGSFQEFYIFSSNLMLYQLEQAKQWFIDGTFSVAPVGFQQLLTIIVYLPSHNVFYPAAYILLTNKSGMIYNYAFKSLVTVAEGEGFKLKPELVMTDFEKALQNASHDVFQCENVGCYFHFVKALIKKAKQLGLIRKNYYGTKTKLLIGLLKILVHCPSVIKPIFFEEIQATFKDLGASYKTFLDYFRKNWLDNSFLKGLIDSYMKGQDIKFFRTNNPCELFNRYLGKFLY